MAAIGSLLFCTACGDLLEGSTGVTSHIIVCEVCGNANKDVEHKPVVSKSKPNAFPSDLRSKHSNVQMPADADGGKEALIAHTCTNCGHPESLYYTKQLRSADEGTTVFYNCPKCGHSETTNN